MVCLWLMRTSSHNVRDRATRSTLKDAYFDLRDRARFDIDFALLSGMSAAIAFLGFRINSVTVIVGAMLISPLLHAILATGGGIFYSDWKGIYRSFFSLLGGLFAASGISALAAYFFPVSLASEIAVRIATGPGDYFLVALFSGLAATFAYYWPGLSEAIPGVAISVAIIPPVVMAGIGFGQADWSLASTGFTIVGLNVIGIYVGSLITIGALYLYAGKHKIVNP